MVDLNAVRAWMLDYQAKYGEPPAVREIAVAFGDAFGPRSTSTVHRWLRRMKDEGMTRQRRGARSAWSAIPVDSGAPA